MKCLISSLRHDRQDGKRLPTSSETAGFLEGSSLTAGRLTYRSTGRGRHGQRRRLQNKRGLRLARSTSPRAPPPPRAGRKPRHGLAHRPGQYRLAINYATWATRLPWRPGPMHQVKSSAVALILIHRFRTAFPRGDTDAHHSPQADRDHHISVTETSISMRVKPSARLPTRALLRLLIVTPALQGLATAG